MTTLTPSPLLIALMQSAASLPTLLLGLPAGATADIFDRRRLLIFWQSWMLAAVAILSVLTFTGAITPWGLLGLTAVLNIGSAMNGPAWQAIVPELVPREDLPDAISINSAGFNLARALGPALGGLMIAAFISAHKGAAAVFGVNALSFVGVIIVLYRWKRTPLFKSALPAERLFGSMRAGMRYVSHAPMLKATLGRAFSFTVFVSAIWALLAVVAQRDLHSGAMGYGILNGSMGIGAVAGAVMLPRMRRKFSPDTIVSFTPLAFVVTLLVMALAHQTPVVVLALMFAGFAWTCSMATFNTCVQLSVPGWVQARALGVYQMVFQGGMALGSAGWGFLAEHSSPKVSLLASAAGLVLSQPFVRRLHLLKGAPPDLSPHAGGSRALPELTVHPEPDNGPVLITIDYRVSSASHPEFISAIHQLSHVRLRDGAIRWGIFQNAADPDHFTETFVVESWLEYLRQRERLTESDKNLRDRVQSFHEGPDPPSPHRMIYAQEINPTH